MTIAGLALWAVALIRVTWAYSLHDQITILIMIPVAIVTGLFSHHFQFPMSKRFTRETFTVT